VAWGLYHAISREIVFEGHCSAEQPSLAFSIPRHRRLIVERRGSEVPGLRSAQLRALTAFTVAGTN